MSRLNKRTGSKRFLKFAKQAEWNKRAGRRNNLKIAREHALLLCFYHTKPMKSLIEKGGINQQGPAGRENVFGFIIYQAKNLLVCILGMVAKKCENSTRACLFIRD